MFYWAKRNPVERIYRCIYIETCIYDEPEVVDDRSDGWPRVIVKPGARDRARSGLHQRDKNVYPLNAIHLWRTARFSSDYFQDTNPLFNTRVLSFLFTCVVNVSKPRGDDEFFAKLIRYWASLTFLLLTNYPWLHWQLFENLCSIVKKKILFLARFVDGESSGLLWKFVWIFKLRRVTKETPQETRM